MRSVPVSSQLNQPAGVAGVDGAPAVELAMEEFDLAPVHAREAVTVQAAAPKSSLATHSPVQVNAVKTVYSYSSGVVNIVSLSILVAASWSTWGSWSGCSATCGGGRQARTRQCRNGNTCIGTATQYRDCNKQTCSGSQQ